jgi:predicted TIM-barrel fold metal-dependent hydrolase
MMIDAHTHLFPHGMDKVGTAEMLLNEMDACKVDKAVILGIYPRVSNEFIAEQGRNHPDRFIHFASVNPNEGADAVTLFKRCVEEYGVHGLKLHPTMQSFDADNVELVKPLMQEVGKANIPVLLHSWAWFGQDSEASPRRVMTLARAFPDITFILAHCGGMGFFDLLPMKRLRKRGLLNNLYVDLSVIMDDLAGSPMWPMLEWVVKIIGVDRVLMGSDFPDYTLADTVRLVRSFNMTDTELSLLTGGNAQRLFGA